MSNKVVNVAAIQQRHDTVANWESQNPILKDGEQVTVFLDGGTTRHKTGCGGKTYRELPFDGCDASDITSATLLASAWNEKQQKIPVAGLEASQNGILFLSGDVSDEQYEAAAAAKLYVSAQDAGSVIVSYRGVMPQTDIPVAILLLG